MIENEYFQVSVSKKTGAVTLFNAPAISIEQIIGFTPSNFLPIHEILPIDNKLRVKLEWDKSYGKNNEDNGQMRLIYRIVSETDAMIMGISAQTGDLIYSLL